MNIKKILSYAIGPVGSAALGMISLPIITWFYSIEDVGRIAMLQIAVSFSTLIFCLGLDQAFVREYHEYENKPQLFKHVIIPPIISILLIGLPLLSLKGSLISNLLYSVSSQTLSIITFLCCVCALISRFLSLILRMEDRAMAYSLSQFLPKLFFVIFILVGYFIKKEGSFIYLSWAYLASFFSVLCIFSWNTRHVWYLSTSTQVNKEKLRLLLQFGAPLIIAGFSSWGLKMIDRISLRTYSDFSEIGVYSVAMNLANGATIFGGIFTIIWAPMVYKWIKNQEDLSKIDRVSKSILAIIYFVFCIAGVFSWLLPYILPNNYQDVHVLFVVCLSGPLLYVLSEATSMGINIMRRTSLAMLVSMVAMIINLIGNQFLVPDYGAIGAAISTSISFLVFFILRFEISNEIWRKTPKVKMYSSLFVLISLMIAMLLFPFYMIYIWLAGIVIGCFLFNGEIKNFIISLSKLNLNNFDFYKK